MDHLPQDPAILVSSINMLLRDEEFDSLESLCYNFNTDPSELCSRLAAHGYVYSLEQKQFRPEGYDQPVFPRDSIESAYCFFHQKQRVYEYSTMDWQKDDIEIAISEYVDSMDPALYHYLSSGNPQFLRDHTRFPIDIRHAVDALDAMMRGL